MLRTLGAGLVLVTCVCGCFGGASPATDDGTLDPIVLARTVDDATFHVRVPSLRSQYKLLNVGRLTGPHGHYAVDFDLVAGNGPILTVDQAEGCSAGVARSYTDGARALGGEHIGPAVWRVYDSPAVGGLVFVTRYRDGVEVALFGGTSRGPLRSLARSLGPLS
jgi:hypothetical protein